MPHKRKWRSVQDTIHWLDFELDRDVEYVQVESHAILPYEKMSPQLLVKSRPKN